MRADFARYIARNPAIPSLCEQVYIETGNEKVISQVKHYRQFQYSDIEDLSVIIERFKVFPRNKIYADFIDGTEIMIIWDKEEQIQQEIGELYTPCLNCGTLVHHMVGRKKKKYCSDKCRYVFWHKQNDCKTEYTKEHTCKCCGKRFVALKN